MKHLLPCELLYEDKHFLGYLKNGMIVDSCVLMEFLKSMYNKAQLANEQKEAFDRLERFLSLTCPKYITPHLLAELSNLINKHASDKHAHFSDFINLIRKEFREYEELPIKKQDVLDAEVVERLGVADTSIILASENNKIILTCDTDLEKECKYVQSLPTISLEDLKSLVLTLQCLRGTTS